MRAHTILLTGILFSIFPSLAVAEAVAGGNTAAEIGSQEKTIHNAGGDSEEALQRKKLGDQYASQENYKQAAGEYLKALALSPSSFTVQERLQMAIAISWADRLDDAALVLRSILAEKPKDREARVQLAKVLSWSDKLNEAEAEADIVLKEHPEDQEALLVKANVLRWRGDAVAAIPVYEKALAQGENFDVRIGLAYAYLDIGEKNSAMEISESQKPLYPYQKKELAKFSNSLCGVRASSITIPFSYYKDSDENTVHRSGLSYGFWSGKWETEITYRLTDAEDPARRKKAEDVSLTSHAQMGRIGTGAGIGISRMDGGNGNVLTGHLGADASMGWGTIGVGVSKEALSDTAQLIENRITRTSESLSLSENVSPRLTFFESYTRSDYSDSNSADDLRFGVKYAVSRTFPKIATGYRFRYWNFSHQSGGGYFDPEGFTSHLVFVSLYMEKNALYAYLEPYVGLQSFTRYGEYTSKSFYGAVASAGWTMKKCTAFEINSEGGNYAGGAVSGFNYYQVGFRLRMYF